MHGTDLRTSPKFHGAAHDMRNIHLIQTLSRQQIGERNYLDTNMYTLQTELLGHLEFEALQHFG